MSNVITDHGEPVAALSLNSGLTGTFSGFAPNAGSTYVVAISADSDNSGTAATLSVAWATGGSGTWAAAAPINQANGFTPAEQVFLVTTSSAPGTSTVSVTGTHISGFTASITELTAPNGVAVGPTTADGTVSHVAITATPLYTGSIIFAMLGDRNESFTITANASSTLLGSSGATNGETFFVMKTNSTTTGGTAVTVGSSTGTATASTQYAVEIFAVGAAAAGNKLFLTTTAADAAVTVGSGTKRLANWQAGSSSTLQNINGAASPPLQLTDGTTAGTNGTVESWYSNPLQAVTISGQIVASLWGKESATSANAAPCFKVEHCAGDGTVLGTIANTSPSQGGLEFATTAGGATKTCTVTSGNITSTALSNGDRLRITLWIDSAANQGGSGTLSTSGNSQFWVNGPNGAAGQSQIAFTETLTVFAPATTTPDVVMAPMIPGGNR